MEYIKLWFISFISATMLITLLKLVLSKSRVKYTTNIIYSLFVIIYIISPFSNIFNSNSTFNFNIDVNEYSQIEIESYENIIRSSIIFLSKENEIEVIDINIESYIDNEKKDVLIEQIIVRIRDKTKTQYFQQIILDKLGFEVQVC